MQFKKRLACTLLNSLGMMTLVRLDLEEQTQRKQPEAAINSNQNR
jgi:hypothetical protein